MPNDVLTQEPIANNQEVLGDQSQLLGKAADTPAEVKKIEPYITIKRGSPFIQTNPGWQQIKDANGEAVIPPVWLRTRFAQWFRYKNDRLEWGGNVWNDKTQTCDSPPVIEKNWIPVRGMPGILTVHKSDGESESFFTVENATTSVWPLIIAKEYIGKMKNFKDKPAILVCPGRYIHRIDDGTVPGHPCYVTGCMIPGEFDKDIPLSDLRSTKNPGIALDRIIKCLDGWNTEKDVRIIVSN